MRPDILIICGASDDAAYLDFPPQLVAEVLSPSTAMRDRNTKFEIYRSQGIKYYLIADPDKETMEVYQLNDNEYNIYNAGDNGHEFIFEDGCTVTLSLSEIW